MTVAPVEPSALDEGDDWAITPIVRGPSETWPARLAQVREIHPATVSEDTDEFPAITEDESADEQRSPAEDRDGTEVATASAAPTEAEVRPRGGPDFTAPVAVTAVPAPAPITRSEIRVQPRPIRQARPAPAPETSPQTQPTPPEGTGEEDERTRNIVRRAWRRFVKRKLDAAEAEHAKHTPWPVVAFTGVFALVATAGAFVLSFTMLVLVMLAMGFQDSVSWLGPIAIDVAALTAATFLVTKDPHYRRLGWVLLVFSTGASIYGNLVGHSIQEMRSAVPFHLPDGAVYGNAGIFFSIFFPAVMAILVHCFMAQLTGNLEFRKQRLAAEAARARRDAEEAERAEREERERREREEAAERLKKEALADLPVPRKRNEEASPEISVQYGLAHEVHTPARLRNALTTAGWKPKSETQLKTYCKEIKRQLGVDAA